MKNSITGKTIPKHLGSSVFRPEVFLGREQDMLAVRQHLLQESNLLLLVNGTGGIGKTTLAAVYYHKYTQNYHYLAWVYAERSIQNALLTIAPKLGMQFDPKMNGAQRLEQLLETLHNLPKPCLLVIDNANNLADLHQHYKALRTCPNLHILLTTRITEFRQAMTCRLYALSQTDAITLFKRYYPHHRVQDNKTLKYVLQAIDRNTLVIELLAKNLNQLNNRLKTRYHLSDLLRDLQTKGILKLSQSRTIHTDYHLEPAHPADIISAMYDLGELSEQESAILGALAVLPAENIAFEVLEDLLGNEESGEMAVLIQLAEMLGDELSDFLKSQNIDQEELNNWKKQVANQAKFKDLDETLLQLAQKGWLDYTEATNSFKISPVIQEVTKNKQKQTNLLDNCRTLISSLIDKLDYETGTGHFENVSYEEAILFARYAESVGRDLEVADNSLAILYERLGSFYNTTGDLHKALYFFEKYFELNKELYESYPSNVGFKNGLAISYEKLGQTHSSLGNLKKALYFFEKYFELNKELYESYPSNVGFKNGLAISYAKLGQTHSSLGNLKKALYFFEKYFELNKELYESYPSNVGFKNGLAISYQFLGNTHSSLGNLNKALTFFEKFNHLIEELYASYPSNVGFKNGLAISYQFLGNTHSSLGNLDKALNFFEKDAQLSKELYESYPSNVGFKNGLAISYEKLGSTHSSLGNLNKALTFFEKCNVLGEQLYASYPSNVGFKYGLAISYAKLGSIYEEMGDTEEAISYFEQCRLLLSELVRDFPAFAEFQRNFAWVQRRLGVG